LTLTIGRAAWRRQFTDHGRRLVVGLAAATFAVGLSGLGVGISVAHADSASCGFYAFYDEQTGPQFGDGTTPHANVWTNQCLGGHPTGGQCGPNPCMQNDGHTWRDYRYVVQLDTSQGGGSEQDIPVHARAWACGTLSYNYTSDWSTANETDSQWYDYGPQDNSCGLQYDWSVTVKAWNGEEWSVYTSDQRATCVEQCPTG
jgi:hypothetical protein